MAGDLLVDWLCCWKDLIYGQACCVYNLLFCPFVTCGWAWSIYVCGCCKVYFNRSFYKFCCCLCRTCGCCWLYTDKKFPPDTTSLGNIGGDSANKESGKSSANTQWVRANKFPGKAKMQLFGDTIDSRDICQGALGDCWLLAAMACLAEHRGAIHSIFRTKERNPKGKYRLRLYDGVKNRWENIVIDDFIPCDEAAYKRDGTCRPLFTQPNGNELYAMLLEKAFAKFCGSYAALEGGQTIWAIRAMTGDPARWFQREGDSWKRYDLINTDDPKNKRATSLRPFGESVNNDMMFEVLLKYHQLGSVLCASGASGKDGLHQGHAYSILEVRKVRDGFISGETFKMVKIRNPWGSGEWTGDWSDKSDLWNKHSSVAKACGHNPRGDTNDGAFWMSWDDYVKNWEKIGVIDRTVDITSVGLAVYDDSNIAPLAACIKGCCRFWCLCLGIRRLYCPHRSSSDTVKVGGCCGFCEKRAATSNQ